MEISRRSHGDEREVRACEGVSPGRISAVSALSARRKKANHPSGQVAECAAERVHPRIHPHGGMTGRYIQLRHPQDFGIWPMAAKLTDLTEEFGALSTADLDAVSDVSDKAMTSITDSILMNCFIDKDILDLIHTELFYRIKKAFRPLRSGRADERV